MITVTLTNEIFKRISAIDENRFSLTTVGLPALYYSGRDNSPHPEIWINYFLRMVELYSRKACELSKESSEDRLAG